MFLKLSSHHAQNLIYKDHLFKKIDPLGPFLKYLVCGTASHHLFSLGKLISGPKSGLFMKPDVQIYGNQRGTNKSSNC